MSFASSRWLILASSLLFFVACEKELTEEKLELVESSIIFGEDDRRSVSGPRTNLSRTVGQIIGTNNGKIFRCSAISLKDEYILTAAHCFYNHGTQIENAYFYPSIRVENITPYGRFPILSFRKPIMYNPNLETLDNIGFDIAVAKVGANAEGQTLKQIIGGTGWWGLKILPHHTVSTMGYPGDKPNSSAYEQEECNIDDYRSLVYTTDCDVFSGQSGSPILLLHEASNQKYVIGVIVGETKETNLVAKITTERQKIIDAITARLYEQEKDKFLEKWQKLDVVHSKTVNIIVKNTCNKDVLVAYTAQDMERKWKTVGFIQVKSQSTVEVTRTPNRIYRLHAHVESNRRVVIGYEHNISVPGSGGTYKFSEYKVEKFQERVHLISNCP